MHPIEKISIHSLEKPWKNMLSEQLDTFRNEKIDSILFSFDPYLPDLSYDLGYSRCENLENFPNYSEHNFDKLYFESKVLDTMYDASEGRVIIQDFNSEDIESETETHRFIKPLIDAVSRWTYDYLISINTPINKFFFRDGVGFYFYSHTLNLNRR